MIRTLGQVYRKEASAYDVWGEVGHFMEPDNEIVIEADRTDAVQQDRLWFLESVDQISRAMQGTGGSGATEPRG
jgi:hypothetical protein